MLVDELDCLPDLFKSAVNVWQILGDIGKVVRGLCVGGEDVHLLIEKNQFCIQDTLPRERVVGGSS